MNILFHRIFIFICFLTIPFYGVVAHSKLFKNTSLKIEIPDTWKCGQSEVYWTCSANTKKNNFFFVTLETQTKQSQDSIENMINRINQNYQSEGHKNIEPIKKIEIKSNPWITHLYRSKKNPNRLIKELISINEKTNTIVRIEINRSAFKIYQKELKAMQNSLELIK